MNPTLRLLPAILALSSTLATAQQQKVVPLGMDFIEGPLVYTYPFGRATGAIQLLYDADQITTQQGLITGMRFRQSQVTLTQTYPSYQKDYKVTAYTVTTPASTMVADVAVNIGSAVGNVVFQGTLTLPAVTAITTYPGPFSIYIPFTTPYVYDGSQGNLLLLIETDDTNAVPTGSYRIDAVNFRNNQITGLAANLDDQGCVVQGQSLTLSTDPLQAIVGGSVSQTLASSSLGAFPYVMCGLSFTTQPTDLTPLGLPSCTSWMGPAVFQFTSENPGGGYPPIVWSLPNTPLIEGIMMAGQALGVPSNQLIANSVTSNGAAVRLGSNAFPIVRSNMAFRGTGNWAMGTNGTFIAVVQFEGVFP
jgi:hypothetical protein